MDEMKCYKIDIREKGKPDSLVTTLKVRALNKKDIKNRLTDSERYVILSSEEIEYLDESFEVSEETILYDTKARYWEKDSHYVVFDCLDREQKVYPIEWAYRFYELMNNIRKGFKKASHAYLEIGVALWEIHDRSIYEFLGYKNIYEFSEKTYDLARGTTNNYINVVQRFCKKDKLKKPIPELDPEYEEFNCSQLIILLALPDGDPRWSVIDSAWSTRQLKEFVKNKNKKIEETSIKQCDYDFGAYVMDNGKTCYGTFASIEDFENRFPDEEGAINFVAILKRLLKSGNKICIVEQ